MQYFAEICIGASKVRREFEAEPGLRGADVADRANGIYGWAGRVTKAGRVKKVDA